MMVENGMNEVFLKHRQIQLYIYYTKNINNVWHSRGDILQDGYTYLLSQLFLMAGSMARPASQIHFYQLFK